MSAQDWDHVVDIIYQHGKQIDYNDFTSLYREVFKDQRFYLSPYNVNPEIVNRERGDRGEGNNPLGLLLEEQGKRDKKAFKKKWREGGQQGGAGDDDNDNDEEDNENDDMPVKQQQIQNLKIDDVMKGMKEENKPVQAMGIVPVINPEGDEDDEDDDEEAKGSDDDDDEDKQNFDPLAGFKKK